MPKIKKLSPGDLVKQHNENCVIAEPHKQIKVLEFKANFTKEQITILERWMNASKSVWNRGLRQLELLDRFTHGLTEEVTDDGKKKKTFNRYYCCPVWEFYAYYLDKNGAIIRDKEAKKDGEKYLAPFCDIDPSKREFIEPIIKQDNFFGLAPTIKGANITDAPWIEDIPYKLRSAILDDLAISWQEYRKSIFGKATNGVFRGKPQYKKREDKIKSISHKNPKDDVFPDLNNPGFLVGMPKEFKTLSIRGLDRWRDSLGRVPLISVVRITRKRNKWFIQLTGEFHSIKPKGIKHKPMDINHVVGLDVGLKYHYASSDLTRQPVEPIRALRHSESKIKRLQRKIDHKRVKRLILWLKSATLEQVKQYLKNIKDSRIQELLNNVPNTPKKFTQIVGKLDNGALLTNMEFQILKAKIPNGESDSVVSNNERKLLEDLSGTHDKIARQRLAFNHKLSTFLVRCYAGIAVEKLNLVGLKRRAKVKKNDKGGYDRNNAKAKSGLNKSFADAGLGQFLQMLETKCKDVGREFVKVNPAYTSQECSNCGTIVKKSLSQRTHECPECGYVEDRDVNAAINIRKRGFPDI